MICVRDRATNRRKTTQQQTALSETQLSLVSWPLRLEYSRWSTAGKGLRGRPPRCCSADVPRMVALRVAIPCPCVGRPLRRLGFVPPSTPHRYYCLSRRTLQPVPSCSVCALGGEIDEIRRTASNTSRPTCMRHTQEGRRQGPRGSSAEAEARQRAAEALPPCRLQCEPGRAW